MGLTSSSSIRLLGLLRLPRQAGHSGREARANAVVVGCALCGAISVASSGAQASAFTFDDTISMQSAPEIKVESAGDQTKRYGELNSLRFNVLAGGASNFTDTSLAQGGIGLSWFALAWFSVELELLGMGAFQDEGKDAVGGDLNVLFRWHFWRDAQESISVFGEAGVGFALFSEEVPPGGSNFNFAPQIGVGASFDLGDDSRLLLGVRWLHLSNARTTDSNDGLDTVLIYAGLSWGF